MLTLVAASVVCQCLCPPVFLFTLHVALEKVNLGLARVCRGRSNRGVVLGKIEDIPGVLWISFGTRNELIGKSCASGRNTISIGQVEIVGCVKGNQVGIVICQSRLVGRFSCGHWGLSCITLSLELRQGCISWISNQILCKGILESSLTRRERLLSILLRELVVVVDNQVKRKLADLICHQLVTLCCRCAIVGAAVCLPYVQIALQRSIRVGVRWHVGIIGNSCYGGDRVVISCF